MKLLRPSRSLFALLFHRQLESHRLVEVRGESCSWKIFGTPVTGRESLDEAFADARTRHSNLRYIKSVTKRRLTNENLGPVLAPVTQ